MRPRRRFREALERKNATPGTHPGSQLDGGSHLKSSNGKAEAGVPAQVRWLIAVR
jgi:hypothetical protein